MKFPDLTRGLCREVGSEFFFPEEDKVSSGGETYTFARIICSGCPVSKECLEWAIRHEEYGMWGGKSPRERRLIRKKRNILFEQILLKDYA